jgi:hypothetical protein
MNGKLARKYGNKYFIDGSFWSAVGGKFIRREASHHKLLNTKRDHQFFLNYQEDDIFMDSHRDTSFLKLLTPDGLYDMMEAGYDFMERLDKSNEIHVHRKLQI